MQPDTVELRKPIERRSFLGGSDARVIMGSDEAALLRLWREKRGEAEPPTVDEVTVMEATSLTVALPLVDALNEEASVFVIVTLPLPSRLISSSGETVTAGRPRSSWIASFCAEWGVSLTRYVRRSILRV